MKKVLPVIVIVVLLLLGLGFFFITRNSPPASAPSESTPEANQKPTGATSQKQSLRSLLGLGTSQMCEFTDDASSSSGKVYVSAGKMRGDFATIVNGEVASSHMYSDGQTIYLWMEGSEMGYKNPIASVEATEVNPTGTTSQANFDINEQVDYRCQAWSADDSMFQLPSGVQFKDLSSMMQDSGVDCSACDALSGDPKTQCRTALGCK